MLYQRSTSATSVPCRHSPQCPPHSTPPHPRPRDGPRPTLWPTQACSGLAWVGPGGGGAIKRLDGTGGHGSDERRGPGRNARTRTHVHRLRQSHTDIQTRTDPHRQTARHRYRQTQTRRHTHTRRRTQTHARTHAHTRTRTRTCAHAHTRVRARARAPPHSTPTHTICIDPSTNSGSLRQGTPLKGRGKLRRPNPSGRRNCGR